MMFDPEVETASWAEQQRADDPAYRRQIAYLFANSRFYRRKLSDAAISFNSSFSSSLSTIEPLP